MTADPANTWRPDHLAGLPPGHEVDGYGAADVRTTTAGWLMRYTSSETRRAYARHQRDFTRWARGHGITHPAQIQRGHVDAWRLSLLDAGYSNATVAVRLSAIGSWWYALADADLVTGTCPVDRVKRPFVDYRHGTTPAAPVEAVARILTLLDQGPEGPRIACELMARWGLRIDEVVGLTPSSLVVDSSGALVLTIIGKGRKPAPVRVPAGDELARRLLIAAERGRARGVLLTGRDGGATTADTVRQALNRACKTLGITPAVRPHQLRVMAITAALDAGHNIDDVATFARHADVRTTRRYDRNPMRRYDAVAATVTGVLDTATRTMQQCTPTDNAPQGQEGTPQ